MQHTHNYQHFALDINKAIIDIKNTSRSEYQQYFCPYCQKEMIAKRGNIRQWHFAHKTDKCSYDKYLHSIAERMILDWFNKNESITLSMNTYGKCRKYAHCLFHDENICKGLTRKLFDLKKYYSKCTQEYRYSNFIADLYCENKTDPDSPIFIEIFVTHECSQEKKNSGIRIIELSIKSEEDILNIVNSTKLEESQSVRLYNFKRKETLVDKFAQPFQKYILHHTMKSHITWRNLTCKNYTQQRKGIYEISIPYVNCIPSFINIESFYMIGKSKAYRDGYLKKDCQLCKWQAKDMVGDTFCKLYKKCGNPKFCNDNDVSKCTMFTEKTFAINDAISELNPYLEKGNIDIWAIDKQRILL